ncbi:hypothetical protein B9G54_04575 [Alloscardovia macacae]|uniref:site-specific DNA-methyltransferase n=1 Tax=Alloscardovia macacae TaxID=1160091 RepID=UPI000A2E7961|nr:site-specific DNA-methyltransferase [Alloscardovia macacae]OTA26469.1 hypothetical protein B9G54_04575 [Alloscardovia macacae]
MEETIHQVEAATPNYHTQAAHDLARLFPQAMSDGKIDLNVIKTLLGEDTAPERERFGLFWPGKADAIHAAQIPTTATLSPDLDHSVHWDTTENIFIEGDNLEVLKILQKHYYGKIKCIYIDPPYNTGKDFVYPDNYSDSITNYLDITGQRDNEGKITTNSESDGRFHSKWLNMMYPRLVLARNLLTQDGVIFISIDDNEVANLITICNEIYGENNQLGIFSRTSAEGGGLAKHVIKGHDYLLAYARSLDSMSPLLRPKDIRGKIVIKNNEKYWIEEDWLRKEFGKYGTCAYEEIIKYYDSNKLKEIDEGLANEQYVLIPKGKQHIVGRYRKISEDGSKFYSIVKHLNAAGVRELRELDRMDKYFDFPKPTSLIHDFVRGATFSQKDRNALVLDFFAGSGTTAHAVMQLNAEDGGHRRCISVQLPEPTPENSEARKAGFQTIADISRERIRRAGTKILEGREREREQLLSV